MTTKSCYFLYSASRRASLSAQVAKPIFYLFELQSPHVTASAKFNRFRNRTDAEGMISAGLGGVLDHVEIEEISKWEASGSKHGPAEKIDGGLLYALDRANYRRMRSLWRRGLRLFQR